MRVNANAVLRSWTLLAAFGSSYAPVSVHTGALHVSISYIGGSIEFPRRAFSSENDLEWEASAFGGRRQYLGHIGQ